MLSVKQIQAIPEGIRERLNHQAYVDVLDCKDPSNTENEYYMDCYYFWKSVDYEEDF